MAPASSRTGKAEDGLWRRFEEQTVLDPSMLRRAVSLTPIRPTYLDWGRLGEGFSLEFASRLLSRMPFFPRTVLDPFAGAGTTLIAATGQGISGLGIEPLPLAYRLYDDLKELGEADEESLAEGCDVLMSELDMVAPDTLPYVPVSVRSALREDDIVTLDRLKKYLAGLRPGAERAFLQLAGLQVLKRVRMERSGHLAWSRWGWKQRLVRPPRSPSAEEALRFQLGKMLIELHLALVQGEIWKGESTEMLPASALSALPKLPAEGIDGVVTSPPYFNGFDYLDNYQVEHWFLGVEEERLHRLRGQLMPTACHHHLSANALPRYGEVEREVMVTLTRNGWSKELKSCSSWKEHMMAQCLVLHELHRILRSGGTVIYIIDDALLPTGTVPMAEVLSVLAEEAGFTTDRLVRYGKMSGRPSRLEKERARTAICQWRKR